MKKSQMIMQQIQNLKEEVKNLYAQGKVDEAHAKLSEIESKQKEYEVQARIEEIEDSQDGEPSEPKIIEPDEPKAELTYDKVFLKAFRGQRLTQEESRILEEKKASLSSGTGEDGGYLIPVDQQTRINELKRSMPALEKHVSVVPVKTLTGSRNIEANALYTPFAEFTEGGAIGDTDSPKFTNISYAIKDRGGILPVPNNLLSDTDTALRGYLDKWLAKKSVATRNKLIIDLLNTLSKVAITDFDDIKKIMNVTLDPAISAGAKVITNQSGFQWLDTLKDNDGNYLLKTDPVDKTKKRINGKEVVVISDKALPNRDDGANYQAPMIIGDLVEGVVLFDREQMSLLATQVGGDAFKYNRTDIRAIEREDVKMFDSEAVVFGEVGVGASV